MTCASACSSVCVMLKAMCFTPSCLAIFSASPASFSVGRPLFSRTTSRSTQRTPRRQPVPSAFIPASFAAKEAGMKALGTGWRRGVRWVDLEVVREKSGRPTLKLAGEAEKIAKQLGVKHIALSITHTEEQALAQVIFEA